MIRARFYVNADDYRPVEWPIKHPYWCTGYSGDDEHAVIVAYADNEAEILRLWPDATDINTEERASYIFTDRFRKPDWMEA